MSKMLNVKDLITVGIFAVILTVSIFIFGMLGYLFGTLVQLFQNLKSMYLNWLENLRR